MNHLSEEQLAMAYYGEYDRSHLAECDHCRAAYERLEAALAQFDALEAPERGEDYGREVWARLAPRLDEPQPRKTWLQWLITPRHWAVAAAMASLLVVAFLAGQRWPGGPGGAAPQPITAQARERILIVALDEHLDRSKMVLLELVNAPKGVKLNLTAEQQRADDLIAANRLYRQAAATAGEDGVASVLEDLERALLEIARSPSRPSPEQFETLRRRIEAQGIVFKVRVIDSKLQGRSQSL